LGENFLDQFDLLIDNHNRQITLDGTAGLANTFGGERLPFSLISHFEGKSVAHRPIVSATVPSYGSHALRLVLDTGASALSICRHETAARNFSNGGNARLTFANTPNGNLSCATWKDTVHWGRSRIRGVDVLLCYDATAEKSGDDGSLPTYLFTRVLVLHSEMYVVVNPVRNAVFAKGLDEMAMKIP
jgi:hypothetical protein